MILEIYPRLGAEPIVVDALTLIVRAPTGAPLAVANERNGVIEFEDIRRFEEFNKTLQATGLDRVVPVISLDSKVKHAGELPQLLKGSF